MSSKTRLALGLLTLTFTAPSLLVFAGPETFFSDVEPAAVEPGAGERFITPRAARLVAVDRAGLAALAERAPAEFAVDADPSAALIRLPDPEGGEQIFRLVDSPILAPELAAQFPEIRTFALESVDRPGVSGRGDLTPQGFHAVVSDPEAGTWYIDPLRSGDDRIHQVYWRRDLVRPSSSGFRCEVESPESAGAGWDDEILGGGGLNLRTYRLAVAATGEFTAFHGGTVTQGMGAIVTTMNRVNAIYEREVAIRMVLVANNHSLVFTDPLTDPYTNNNAATMMGQNQTTLNTVIGSANYDIGHVFSTAGSGIALLESVCGASKARGVSGAASPIGDAFYVDAVAHEMGHQWGATHTSNGSTCSSSGSYEPGSGSTLMSLAGDCGAQNIALQADAYFHNTSIGDIQAFSRLGDGSVCAGTVVVGNASPTASAFPTYTIPASTPFALTGSGNDSDGSGVLTYAWEQFDLGPAGHPDSPTGDAPIFRSFPPTTSPTRTFPQISDLVNNVHTLGELLPTYGRVMTFRLTVRDNDLPAGNTAGALTTVTVHAGPAPFRVTAPDTPVTWVGTGPHVVTWNVAGTAGAPVSCSRVDIALSSDGGLSFPRLLRADAPNAGVAEVMLTSPNINTARIRVKCVNNIFFDISNVNFSITGAATLFEDGFESATTSAWSQTLP